MARLLLDTHAFLWWTLDDAALSARAREAIAAPENEVYLSAAVVWEIAIKAALGRLEAPADLGGFIAAEARRSCFRPLPIGLGHAAGVRDLPPHHGDPFDRLLISQARREGLTLVTGDAAVTPYGVPVLW